MFVTFPFASLSPPRAVHNHPTRAGSLYSRAMTARVSNVTIYAEDPAALARFWAAVMDARPEGNEFCLQ